MRLVLDTNTIRDESPGMSKLWTLADSGRVELLRTDVVDTELGGRKDPADRSRLLALSAVLPEVLGIAIADHSRADHTLAASDEDEEEWDRIWATVWPHKDRAVTDHTNVRDAMNVWTAIRIGAHALVTNDEALQRRSDAVHNAYGLLILSPIDAATHAAASR